MSPLLPRSRAHGAALRRAEWVVVVAIAATGSGCADEDVGCPAVAQASVRLHVLDANGSPVEDARITSRIGTDAERPEPCNAVQPGGRGCGDTYLYLNPGTFTLKASRPDGSSSAEETITILNAGTASCVGTTLQEVTLVLDP